MYKTLTSVHLFCRGKLLIQVLSSEFELNCSCVDLQSYNTGSIVWRSPDIQVVCRSGVNTSAGLSVTRRERLRFGGWRQLRTILLRPRRSVWPLSLYSARNVMHSKSRQKWKMSHSAFAAQQSLLSCIFMTSHRRSTYNLPKSISVKSCYSTAVGHNCLFDSALSHAPIAYISRI